MGMGENSGEKSAKIYLGNLDRLCAFLPPVFLTLPGVFFPSPYFTVLTSFFVSNPFKWRYIYPQALYNWAPISPAFWDW